MSSRPYLQYSAQELEALAAENWGSVEVLRGICDELGHRSTPKAQGLERRVSARLAELRPGSQAKGHNGSINREIELVRAQLVLAQQLLRVRDDELASLRRQLAESQGGNAEGSPAGEYRAVGLDPGCPDFLVIAAKRVWMKEHHPDALHDRPAAERRAAEEKFKTVQNIFDKIFVHRAPHG